MIRKIEIERFSLTSSKPFDQVVAALNAAIGHPGIVEFGRSTHEARSFAELKSAVEKGLSKAGLRAAYATRSRRSCAERNGSSHTSNHPFAYRQPTHHEKMAKHVPDAGSYAQVTVLVDDRADGVHL